MNTTEEELEREALKIYYRMIQAGFSDYEARAEAWPEPEKDV